MLRSAADRPWWLQTTSVRVALRRAAGKPDRPSREGRGEPLPRARDLRTRAREAGLLTSGRLGRGVDMGDLIDPRDLTGTEEFEAF